MRKHENGIDNRPDPKPRLRPQLWQQYLIWHELVELRKRHTNRLKSIVSGKSNLSSLVETSYMDDMGIVIHVNGETKHLNLDKSIDFCKKIIIDLGASSAPVPFEWLTSIRGLGEASMAVQLIALIDDIGKFATISKLWRYAGYAVINGEIDKPTKGETLVYNRKLKSLLYLIGASFIKQRTAYYTDIYYAEKDRQRELHPELKPLVIDLRARRKMIKIFLSHLWLVWRDAEGLPVSKPWIIEFGGHSDFIEVYQPIAAEECC